ncbi:hypothetical protein BDV23DRAFT_180630 [Aspergillus alliaceus]|uniref:Uncharacterized protein n=1 Tax=Petromyces alliaceus TaxID=209559 RepID=A0A5N7CHM5_PETAA|nr:uncharacterized protein BDW43DRAFT_310303 [Aspergillus alliaceus]KAB8234275.1 hypothetical protein BDW43DRAFT_310303 [Aspergillus alliaceus]KAE8393575.1 hypothetical protein BDV23DRAFT_180630 [Aspergillus alliaceus]
MQFKLLIAPLLVATAVAAPALEEVEGHLAKRTCWSLTGEKLKLCQEACKAACTVGTAGLAMEACEKACDLGPLKTREAAPEAEADPSFGNKACNVACDVTCNSTVLALDQKKCLEICKGKCNE